MSREEVKTLLGENATEEQVSNVLNMFHKTESANKKAIDDLNTKINSYSDYEDIKSQLNEFKVANMTNEQKLKAMEEETKENLRKSKMIVNTATAKNILAGYNITDDLLNALVVEDATATTNNATRLKEQMETLKVLTEKQVQEKLVSVNVQPTVSNVVNEAMTWDKFSKLSIDEQNRFANDHPDEFAKL